MYPYDEDDGGEIGKALRDYGKNSQEEYPRDLYTAQKAILVTTIRKNKKPGCRGLFMLIAAVMILTLVALTSYLIFAHAVTQASEAVLWVATQGYSLGGY